MVNETRSLNQDLYFGSKVDGFLKILTPDRGGEVDTSYVRQRAQMLQAQYNISDMGHAFGCPCVNCN